MASAGASLHNRYMLAAARGMLAAVRVHTGCSAAAYWLHSWPMPGAVGIEAEYVADFAVVQAVEIAVAQTVLCEVTVVLAGAQWSCLRARAQG